MQRVIDWLADGLVRRKYLGWAVVVAVSALAALGWSGVSLGERRHISWASIDSQDLARDMRVIDEASDRFDFQGLPCVFVIESDDFFRADRMLALRETVKKIERAPGVASVLWIGRIPRMYPFGIDFPADSLIDGPNREGHARRTRFPSGVGGQTASVVARQAAQSDR